MNVKVLVLLQLFNKSKLRNRTQRRSPAGGGGRVLRVNSPFVANVASYILTFIRILQNLYFIYPI